MGGYPKAEIQMQIIIIWTRIWARFSKDGFCSSEESWLFFLEEALWALSDKVDCEIVREMLDEWNCVIRLNRSVILVDGKDGGDCCYLKNEGDKCQVDGEGCLDYGGCKVCRSLFETCDVHCV